MGVRVAVSIAIIAILLVATALYAVPTRYLRFADGSPLPHRQASGPPASTPQAGKYETPTGARNSGASGAQGNNLKPFHPISVSDTVTVTKTIKVTPSSGPLYYVWIQKKYTSSKEIRYDAPTGETHHIAGSIKISATVISGNAKVLRPQPRIYGTHAVYSSDSGESGSIAPPRDYAPHNFCKDVNAKGYNLTAKAYIDPFLYGIPVLCYSSECTVRVTITASAGVGEGACSSSGNYGYSSGGGGGGGSGSGDRGVVARLYVVGDAGGADLYPFYLSGRTRWLVNGSTWTGEAGRTWLVGVPSTSFNASDLDALEGVALERRGGRLELHESYGGDYRDGFPYRQIRLTAEGRGTGDIYLRFKPGARALLAGWSHSHGNSRLNATWLNSTTMLLHVHVAGYFPWQAGWVKARVDYAEPVALTAYRIVVKQGNRTIAEGDPPWVAFKPNETGGPYEVYVYVSRGQPPPRFTPPRGRLGDAVEAVNLKTLDYCLAAHIDPARCSLDHALPGDPVAILVNLTALNYTGPLQVDAEAPSYAAIADPAALAAQQGLSRAADWLRAAAHGCIHVDPAGPGRGHARGSGGVAVLAVVPLRRLSSDAAPLTVRLHVSGPGWSRDASVNVTLARARPVIAVRSPRPGAYVARVVAVWADSNATVYGHRLTWLAAGNLVAVGSNGSSTLALPGFSRPGAVQVVAAAYPGLSALLNSTLEVRRVVLEAGLRPGGGGYVAWARAWAPGAPGVAVRLCGGGVEAVGHGYVEAGVGGPVAVEAWVEGWAPAAYLPARASLSP